MKPKYARLRFLLASVLIMGIAAYFILHSLRDNLVFFYTPTELAQKRKSPNFNSDQGLRIGGLVKNHSVKNLAGGGIAFTITDLTHDIHVTYHGMIPSLFREGQGVVAQGTLKGDSMNAETILAKHDENYMPRDVVDALKKSGQWKEGGK